MNGALIFGGRLIVSSHLGSIIGDGAIYGFLKWKDPTGIRNNSAGHISLLMLAKQDRIPKYEGLRMWTLPAIRCTSSYPCIARSPCIVWPAARTTTSAHCRNPGSESYILALNQPNLEALGIFAYTRDLFMHVSSSFSLCDFPFCHGSEI